MTDINQISRALHPKPASEKVAATDDQARAAREFERVLVKQFVQVMTKDLFKSIDDGAMSSVEAYGDIQRDTLADVLTDHLVDSGTFNLQDLLLRQWARQATSDASDFQPSDQS